MIFKKIGEDQSSLTLWSMNPPLKEVSDDR